MDVNSTLTIAVWKGDLMVGGNPRDLSHLRVRQSRSCGFKYDKPHYYLDVPHDMYNRIQ